MNSLFSYHISSTDVLSDFNSSISQGTLSISGLQISGIATHTNYYAVQIFTNTSYCNLIFSIVFDTLPFVNNISVSAIYGVPLIYNLPIQNYSIYSSLYSELNIEPINGILTWPSPTVSTNFSIVLTDPRFPSTSFEFEVIVLRPLKMKPIDQTQLLFYYGKNASIVIFYDSNLIGIVDYDTSLFVGDASNSGYFLLYPIENQPFYNLMTYVSVINDGFTDSQFLFLFNYPIINPVFYDITEFICVVGETYSIDLRNCKFYADVSYFLPDYQNFTFFSDKGNLVG